MAGKESVSLKLRRAEAFTKIFTVVDSSVGEGRCDVPTIIQGINHAREHGEAQLLLFSYIFGFGEENAKRDIEEVIKYVLLFEEGVEALDPASWSAAAPKRRSDDGSIWDAIIHLKRKTLPEE